MEFGLGSFGDGRLEKGGPFCTVGLSRWDSVGLRCVPLAAIELARFGSRAFCATTE
jgi:hypothetical protein